MRCGSHFKLSVIGPEKGCKSLRSCLAGSAFQIRVWTFPQLLELLTDVEGNPDQIVILIMTDERSALMACRLLMQRLSGTRLLLIYDYPHESPEASDCLPAPSALPASLKSLLDCLGDEKLTNIAENPIGQEPPSQNPLSMREIEILSCLVHGHANKRIARVLNIAEATVKVHVKAILRKLHLANRTQAAIWAVQHGFAWEPQAPVEAAPAQERFPLVEQWPIILPTEFH